MKKSQLQWTLLALITFCILNTKTYAAIIMLDPDSYLFDTVLSNISPGMALSVVNNGVVDPAEDVIAVYNKDAAFPSNLIGHTHLNNSIDDAAFQLPWVGLRADFASTTDYFEVTIMRYSIVQYSALIQAYDANNALIQEIIVPYPAADSVAVTINQPSISWVFISGYNGTPLTVDRIRYSAVPIPPSVWLFGSGLLGLAGIARRKKAA